MNAKKLKVWSEKGFQPFRLEVLTPVLIGSGDVLSPLEYVLGGKDDDHLYHIDVDAWMSAFADDKDVMDIVSSGSVPRIRRMMQEKVDPAVFSTAKTDINPSLKKSIQQEIVKEGSNKTNEISAFLRNPLTGAPYIPGSSLKGAMSTPIIDNADRLLHELRPASMLKPTVQSASSFKDKQHAYRQWMNDAFGKISEHAMSAFKVSDCPAPSSAIRIFTSQEVAFKAERTATPKPPAEALRPGTKLWGRLFMASQEEHCQIVLPSGQHIDFSMLRTLCNAYYRSRYEKEKAKFYRLPHLKATLSKLEKVDAKLASLDECQALLLRVGRYSHVECITVTENAPFRRRGKTGLLPSGTTRTLADGELPYGWVLLQPCTAEEYFANALQKEKESQAVWEQTCMSYLDRLQAEREALDLRSKQEAERKAAEEARRKAEEAEQAKLASMSEEDRLEMQLRSGKLDENATMQVYAKLDSWDEPVRRRLASALMDAWKAMGKLNKPSKKQKEKLEKIKAILK